jgi:hypothetical protein
VAPVVDGRVRGQKRTRVSFFVIYICGVFKLPSPRNAKKRDKKHREKRRFWVFGQFVCKNFLTRPLRNTRNRDKKKIEEKLTSKFLPICLENVFDMYLLQKYFNGVLELPLPRNARKRTKKKQEKKSVGGWVGLGYSKYTRYGGGGPSIFLAAPRISVPMENGSGSDPRTLL